MPNTATMKLLYRVLSSGTIDREATVEGWPNAIRSEFGLWADLFKVRSKSVQTDTYGEAAAFVARTRFLAPAAAEFFVLAPTMTGITKQVVGKAGFPEQAVSISLEAVIDFVGDFNSGVVSDLRWIELTLDVWSSQYPDVRTLASYVRGDKPIPASPAAPARPHQIYGSGWRWANTQALDEQIAQTIESGFGTEVRALLASLPYSIADLREAELA